MKKPSKRLILTGVEKKLGDLDHNITIQIPLFELHQREIVAIVGANGCGKSTMLDMIAMLCKPDRAEQFSIYFDNGEIKDIQQLGEKEINELRRNHIAYILQSGGLLEFLTLKQNISLVTRLKKGKQANLNEIVESLGIEKIINKKPIHLSGGQRQKGAVARALIQQPDIILADEPTSAMDSLSAVRLMENLTRRVKDSGSSLILVSHDASLVQGFANRVYRFSLKQVNDETISILQEEDSLGD
ncbi:ABC transporter ATP-binding protein [Photobacterium leiognathi]|uniref:ABC transporter ATP-binding protein n=1 Tax=Photobacterium leiognathi subsp. mandapamensis TaxID=48408 RepID=A0A2T3KZ30_PHOLD|nr:ABC transporter ATP-binding protein [Photobacterium leiognathi]PSV13371.1 ABC transporter ATP-binding protein [Photobacterium leiognathi subsp. mandapamensis]